jgi:hypothetical protein
MIRPVLLAAALAFAAAASAQTSSEPPVRPAEELLASLPDTLLGAAALRMPGSELVTYFPMRLGKDPMVGVVAGPLDKPSTIESIRDSSRGAFHESGLRTIVREGTFTTPKWPGARTFFGEYVTGSGFKQSWTVETDEVRVSAIATYFRKKDAERVQAEVAEKIFGGAVVEAAQPAE